MAKQPKLPETHATDSEHADRNAGAERPNGSRDPIATNGPRAGDSPEKHAFDHQHADRPSNQVLQARADLPNTSNDRDIAARANMPADPSEVRPGGNAPTIPPANKDIVGVEAVVQGHPPLVAAVGGAFTGHPGALGATNFPTKTISLTGDHVHLPVDPVSPQWREAQHTQRYDRKADGRVAKYKVHAELADYLIGRDQAVEVVPD